MLSASVPLSVTVRSASSRPVAVCTVATGAWLLARAIINWLNALNPANVASSVAAFTLAAFARFVHAPVPLLSRANSTIRPGCAWSSAVKSSPTENVTSTLNAPPPNRFTTQ